MRSANRAQPLTAAVETSVSEGALARFSFTSGRARSLAVCSIEAVTILFAAVLAFLLRFDFSIPYTYIQPLEHAAAVWLLVKLAAFKTLGLDRRWARYISISDLLRLAFSNLLGTVVSAAVLLLLRAGVPRTVYAIDLLLCVTITAFVRIAVRLAAESARPQWSPRTRTAYPRLRRGRRRSHPSARPPPEPRPPLRRLRHP